MVLALPLGRFLPQPQVLISVPLNTGDPLQHAPRGRPPAFPSRGRKTGHVSRVLKAGDFFAVTWPGATFSLSLDFLVCKIVLMTPISQAGIGIMAGDLAET